MQQETLTVGLGHRAYDIVIGPDLIDRAGSILGPIAAGRHIIIVSDKKVAALHLDRLKAGLKSAARAIDHFEAIDRQIIRSLVSEMASQTVSSADVLKITRERRQSHWYPTYEDIYRAIGYATDSSRLWPKPTLP